jgi:phosphate transport system protein
MSFAQLKEERINMLPQYHDARHSVRDTVIELVESLIETHKVALEAIENDDAQALEKARTELKEMAETTEKVDNDVVLIFAKFTPGARDLREMVSYLKVTSALNRIRTYTNNYLKNMQTVLIEDCENTKEFVKDSLRINKCTIKAFEHIVEMLNTFDNNDKIKKLASQISVENSKTEDIYSILEKDMVQSMHSEDKNPESYFNLLKYFRKNLKIIDRLETIAQRVIFARMGGKL